MDALTLLEKDHRTVKGLFTKYGRLGERATAKKRKLVETMIRELSVHSALEEQIFYPTVRSKVEDAEDQVLESLEEHHVMKWSLSELERMKPTDERFDAKVTVMMELVVHHIHEEEEELFPQVRRALGVAALRDLGAVMARARPGLPTRPHPRVVDTPPGNVLVGALAKVVDSGRDLLRGAKQAPRRAAAAKRATGKRKPAKKR